MVQILAPKHHPSFSEKLGLNDIGKQFGEGFTSGIEKSLERKDEMRQESEKAKRAKEKAELDYENALRLKEYEYGQKKEIEGLKGSKKSPPGGLTGQAVPQEVSLAANKIIQTFPEANADQLKMMMDEVGIPPAYSNGYVENRRRQDERKSASKDKRLEAGQKRAEKVIDETSILAKELPILESSVNTMEDAILNGDLSFWSPDNLAEITGIELFRTARGAQFKTAAKTYFIEDLKASGARPNQFIEKQLVDALTKIGRSQEANQAVLESFKFSNDLKRKRVQTVKDLEKYYYDSVGYVPGNFQSLVDDIIDPYITDRQKSYQDKLKELSSREKNNAKKSKETEKLSGKMVDVIGPDGQEYEVDESEVGILPEGYRVR